MKKIITLLSFLIINSTFLIINVLAQAPAIEWQKSLGGAEDDAANSIMQTSDGGYIVAGSSKSIDGDVTGHHGTTSSTDFWVVKLDNTGTAQWKKSLGGTGGDNAISIEQTTDGGYIVAGFTSSLDGDVSGNNGFLDCWVVKLDDAGVIEWQNALGGTGIDYGVSVKQTSDGYIVGATSYSADGEVTGHHGTTATTDVWMVKLDNVGALQWQKSLGGTGSDFVASVAVTTDGGFIVSGKSNSTDGDVTGNHGGDDCWVVKLDGSGVIQWQKSLGGTDGDAALSIIQTNDGGYAFAGTSMSNDGDVTGHHGAVSVQDYWVVKLLSNGNLDWQKSLGGNGVDGGTGIWQNSDGGYFVAGHSYSNDGDVTGHHGTANAADFWVVRLDGTGTLQWGKSMGGTSNELNAVYANQQTSDGGFVIAGTSNSTDGDVTGHHATTSVSDYWVVKLEGGPVGIAYAAAHEKSISIYPNPVASSSILKLNAELKDAEIVICDMLGKEIMRKKITSDRMEIEKGSMESGVYFVRVKGEDLQWVEKMVVD